MVPSRVLAANPGKVWGILDTEGSVVITKDGKPRGILVRTSEETLLEDLHHQIQARARHAVSVIRREAARKGLADISLAEITAEVAAVRKMRKSRRG